jgi:hypothetical protein
MLYELYSLQKRGNHIRAGVNYQATLVKKMCLLRSQTRFAEAADCGEKLLALGSAPAADYCYQSELLFYLGQLEAANDVLVQALALAPHAKRSLVMQGYLLLVAKQLDKAAATFNNLLTRQHPKDRLAESYATQGLGLVAFATQDRQLLFKQAEQQIQAKEVNFKAFLLIKHALVLRHWQQWSLAQNAFAQALKLMPTSDWLLKQQHLLD